VPKKAAPPIPPLAVRRLPGLSATLRYPPHPARCQNCGLHAAGALVRWLEHDEWDKPTRTIVVLCEPCGARLIDPHHRLYVALERNRPWTGCMGLCVRCQHRRGTSCAHPDAKVNGGPGLEIVTAEPTRMHIYCSRNSGGRFSGWRTEWPEPARSCAGRLLLEGAAPPNGEQPALPPATATIDPPRGA
jgi:hypothetical protein